MLLFLLFIHTIFHYSISQTTQNINVLLINEENNALAEKSFEIAKEYVRRNPSLGLAVDPIIVVGNRTDAKAFLENVCRKYSDMVSGKKPPHVVLDFTTTGVGSETIKSFTSALGLPTVSGSYGKIDDQWQNLNSYQARYLLQVMPPADLLPELIRATIIEQDITNAAILYDDSFVMDYKYNSLLHNIPTRHLIMPVSSKDDIQLQLKSIRELRISNIFVIGRLQTIKIVLDAANGKEYFRRKTAWFALTLDKGDITCNCENATIIFMQPTPDSNSKDRLEKLKTTYNLNGEPEITSAFYFDLSLRTFFAIKSILDTDSWPKDMKYIGCDDSDGKNIPKRTIDLKTAFKKIKEATYAPFFIPNKGSMNGRSYIKFTTNLTAVTIKDGAIIGRRSLGKWNSGFSSRLNLTDEDMTIFSAPLVYKIVAAVQHPFIIKDEHAPKGLKGFCIDLIDEISRILKFDYEIRLSPDGKYGTVDEHGKWNGIVKELMEDRADIGLGSLSVMPERETVVDFTVPYYQLVGFTILMKVPRKPTSLFKFSTVLENDVWISILVSYFFTSFLMWVFEKLSPFSYRNNREMYKDDDEKREFTLKECLWFCMTSLTHQGGGEAPKHLSGRLLAATWWLFGFTIVSSYTANLAAFLTVSRMETSIESLEDLAKQYKIQYAPVNNTPAMKYFERMANIESKFHKIWVKMTCFNDSLSEIEEAELSVWEYPLSSKYTKMWEAMKEAGLPHSQEEAVARVQASTSSHEGFAWLTDATDVRYLVMTNCDLQQVGNEFSEKPYALAVQNGSSLKEQLDRVILQLNSDNVLEALKEKWWNNNPENVQCEQVDELPDGISIQNIGGVFIATFVGINLACLILGVEYWWHIFRKRSDVTSVTQFQKPAKISKTKSIRKGK